MEQRQQYLLLQTNMKRLTWLFCLLPFVLMADVPVPPAASQAEVNAGTIHSKFVAPDTLKGAAGKRELNYV